MRTFNPSISWDPLVEQYLAHALGPQRLAANSASLCRPSLRTSVRLNTLRAPAQELLQRLQQQLGSAAGRPQPFLHPHVPATAIVPGLGPLQPDYEACCGREVVVTRHAAESVLKGAHVYSPGLLAVTPGMQQGDLVAVSAALDLPGSRWCGINRGLALSPEANRQLPDRSRLFIGAGRVTAGRVGLFRQQQGLAVEMEPGGRVFDIPSMQGILRGSAMLQALPCIIAAHELDPQPGRRVLDLCAAPGGKATMLAQLMGDTGQVVALDRTQAKVEQVLSLASDLGLSCVQAFAADSTQLFQRLSGADSTSSSGGSSSSGSEQGRAAAGDERSEDSECSTSGSNSEEGSSRRRQQLQLLLQPESFDYVMLDAPCSALGLRPRLQLEWTLPQLKKLAAYQRAFLHTAVHMLKPGGTLVYCTCTINPGENEENVAYALAKWPQMQLVPQRLLLGSPGLAGIAAPGCSRALAAAEASLLQRFDPGGPHDTIGFFISKFVKTASTLECM